MIGWLMRFFGKKAGDEEEPAPGALGAPSRSSKIEQLEQRTDDAMRRLRAAGVRVEVYEIRRKEQARSRSR